ncbi:MAG: 50S ribosomal protein L11 [Armatimonadetes bacterium]|nr:50S ribosomal protein L11 [Armatimonadota bacterium]NIM24728.1 50S ribosomal protein L11 [Armatimonadota bacterium]NIM68608.1 50S ribosomal protein L11 [Armatimonadota bacterium]NIM77125.1 50S ribosomal protein L11 [Armatimonadota bacterium]NIN06802.1 50S ribosomal protein L11 [Armatimonadota bacterium]
MAKRVAAVIKLNIKAGQATSGPPVGPTLAPYGMPIMEFVKQYNAQTQNQAGSIVPAEVTIYADRTFSFILKTPPTSELLKKAAGIEKGSGTAGKEEPIKVGADKVREIAQTKLKDLNTTDVEAAAKIVAGTARSMGIEVEE